MSTANTPCTLPCQLILINIASSSSYSSSSSTTMTTTAAALLFSVVCAAKSRKIKRLKTNWRQPLVIVFCFVQHSIGQGGLKQNPMMASSEGKSPPMSNRTIKAAFSRRLQRTSKHQLDHWRPKSSIGTCWFSIAKDPNIHNKMTKHKNNCRIMKRILHPMFYTPKAFDQRMLHQPKVIWVL